VTCGGHRAVARPAGTIAAVSRVERLLNLTAALLTASRPLTRAELRERVPGYPPGNDDRGAFRRAFERDKDALREMGIPVVVREVPGTDPPIEGYLIPRDQYALRDPGLEPDELAAIHLAAAAVRLEGLRGDEAIWKLGGVPEGGGRADTVAAVPTIPQLVPLFAAVSERRPVTFRYRGEDRTVDPHRLSFTRGRWYLDGEDHTRGAPRQFRLDRVEGPVALGEPGSFERPSSLDTGSNRPWEMGDEEPLEARLRVDADLAGWAVDHLGSDAVVGEDDEGVEVALRVTNRDAFRSFVLGFLDHAEVLGPPELRADMVAWLQDLAEVRS
jgi:proteasome accessory factor B